jgi:NADH:ubiquinone oxidoreductase subunit 5 (subunit L)/multisubunit Na+/H+ antiporter MnhA subunit
MALTRFKVIIILFSIWILAIVLPTVRFAPGNWSLLHLERIQEQASPGMQVLIEIIGICLIVNMAILGIFIVISIWRRRRKKQEDDYFIYRENPPVTWPVYVVIVLLFVGLGSLIWLSWRHADVFEDLMGPRRSVETPRVEDQHPPAPKSSAPETRRPEIHTVSSPKWRVPLILALLFLLGLSLRYILQSKLQTEGPGLKQVVQVVSNATKDLGTGTELSDIVLRCYRDMCKILGRKVAMSRDLTAREFTKLLLQTGIREQEVTRLTDLFERVRYGHHITDSNEQAEALVLFKIIEEKYGRSSNET